MNGWHLLGAFVCGIAACWLGFWLIMIRDFLPGLWADIKHRWGKKLWPVILWLPLIMGSAPAPQQAPTDPIVTFIPGGYTAHLENPNIMIDRTGTLFATTRPNSGVGSFVWMVKDGQTTIVLDLGPDKSYALAEFFIDQRTNWLYFVTIEKADHSKLVAYPIKEWTP